MNRRLTNKIPLIALLTVVILLWLAYRGANVYDVKSPEMVRMMDNFEPFNIPDVIHGNESFVHRLLDADSVNLDIIKVIGPDLYGYNILQAHKLPLLRKLPDTRPPKCVDLVYDISDSDRVSIIIPVYNEGYSVLMRTVYTIVHRSPNHLVKEIILIDDCSPYHDTRMALVKLRNKFQNVIVHRLKVRQGLIKAKIQGESIATSEVIVFLDSHTEVNEGWLPPLVSEIKKDPSIKVVVPVIDTIDAENFNYLRNPVTVGGFNWGLYFTWLPKITVPDDEINPVRSPTLSGGYFAMTKTMFRKFGGYDHQMKSWGGENLEMSFRIWQCGGEITLIPCSRVGHIFRSKRPYGETESGDTWLWNTLRMANVWMDGYIERFYKIRPEAKFADFGDITDRIKLRSRLKCNSFKWYLKQLLPDMLAEQ